MEAIWLFIGVFVGAGLSFIHRHIEFKNELRVLENTLTMRKMEMEIKREIKE